MYYYSSMVMKLNFKVLRRGPFMATDTSKINETNPRIPKI